MTDIHVRKLEEGFELAIADRDGDVVYQAENSIDDIIAIIETYAMGSKVLVMFDDEQAADRWMTLFDDTKLNVRQGHPMNGSSHRDMVWING